jgi:hypothetical protein
VTREQRINNAIELIRPLDKDGLAEIAKFIAIELGAMKTADEYRELATNPFIATAYRNADKTVIESTYVYDGPHSNS